MSTRHFIGAALAALCSVCAVTADDWYQWRGPDRSGLSRETGLLDEWPDGGPKLLWKAENVGEEIAGEGPSSGHPSVLVRLDDAYQLGFLVEELANGHAVVFMPGAPRPWDGDVLIVEQSRVELVSPSSTVAVKCLQRLGNGAGALLERKIDSSSAG